MDSLFDVDGFEECYLSVLEYWDIETSIYSCPLLDALSGSPVISGDCTKQCSLYSDDDFRILQGAEYSDDGTLYIGSEFGSPRGEWYALTDWTVDVCTGIDLIVKIYLHGE